MFPFLARVWRGVAVYACLLVPATLACRDIRVSALLAFSPFIVLLLPAAFACFGAAGAGRWGERIGWTLYRIWALTYVPGYLILCFLGLRYGLGPFDVPVIESVAHTTRAEAMEFASDIGWLPLGVAVLICLAGAGYLARVMHRLVLPALRLPRNRLIAGGSGVLQLAILALLHTNVVIARANPMTLLPLVLDDAFDLKAQTASIHGRRAGVPGRLAAWHPVYSGPAQKTVVLVIGESSNRWDWSLYGYSRQTNPELEAIRPELQVFTDVVSSFGATMMEMTRMLTPADALSPHDWQNEPSVVNLAHAAGYRTFWITNQSFPFANAVFGDESDVHVSVYQGRYGRHDGSLDERLLPALSDALRDPAPLKFIVLHLMGSHPDYRVRYPDAFDRFGHQPDAIDATMRNRWFWVRWKRAEYDNSVLYTDHLLASVIATLKRDPMADSTMLFLSDHAQDVGHLTGAWGHQFHLESGFTVPLILWQKNRVPEAGLATRPYQTDHLESTLLPLLGIRTAKDKPEYDLFGTRFRPWTRVIDGRAYLPGVSHRPPERAEVAGR